MAAVFSRCPVQYSCNPPQTEAYLESPLDTESKPPMLFEKMFEKVYYDCNVRPLFEKILRESQEVDELLQ